MSLNINGRGERIRTSDPLVPNQAVGGWCSNLNLAASLIPAIERAFEMLDGNLVVRQILVDLLDLGHTSFC